MSKLEISEYSKCRILNIIIDNMQCICPVSVLENGSCFFLKHPVFKILFVKYGHIHVQILYRKDFSILDLNFTIALLISIIDITRFNHSRREVKTKP